MTSAEPVNRPAMSEAAFAGDAGFIVPSSTPCRKIPASSGTNMANDAAWVRARTRSFAGAYQERSRPRSRSLRCAFHWLPTVNKAWSLSTAGRSGSCAIGSSLAIPAWVIRSMTAARIASFERK